MATLTLFLIVLYSFVLAFSFNTIELPEGSVQSHLGLVFDLSSRAGKEENAAFEIALEDYSSSTGETPVLYLRDVKGNAMDGTEMALHLMLDKEMQIEALVPSNWVDLGLTVATVAYLNKVPSIFLGTVFIPPPNPFLIHMHRGFKTQMMAIGAIIKSYGWQRIVMFTQECTCKSENDLPFLSNFLQQECSYFSKHDVQFLFEVVGVDSFIERHILPDSMLESTILEMLLPLKSSQVFIVHTLPDVAAVLFDVAARVGLMEKGYIWIVTNTNYSLLHSFHAMQGVIAVKDHFPRSGEKFREFRSKFLRRFCIEYPEEDDREPGDFAVLAYDTAQLLFEALRVRSDGEKRAETILTSNFSGLSGSVSFLNNRLVPASTVQILNIVGRRLREIGFWSSESHAFSITDDGEIGGYNPSMGILRGVHWPGGASYLPLAYAAPPAPIVPISLKIGVPSHSLFPEFVEVSSNVTSNESFFTGFVVNLFETIVKRLPYELSYELIPYSGSRDSLIEEVSRKTFDASIGDLSIVSNQLVEFTQPFEQSGVVMLVMKQVDEPSVWSFTKPFQLGIWLSILTVYIVNGLVIWCIERDGNEFFGEGTIWHQLSIAIWFAFSTLLSRHGGELHRPHSRVIGVIWLTFTLVLISTYSANLTTILSAAQQTEIQVSSLIMTNAMIGVEKGMVSNYVKNKLGFHALNLKEYDTEEGFSKALKNREIQAVFLEYPHAKLFLRKNCQNISMVGSIYDARGYGFVFPRGSPFVRDFSQIILELTENKELESLKLKNQLGLQGTKCSEDSSGPRTLVLHDFLGLFIIALLTPLAMIFIYCLPSIKGVLQKMLSLLTDSPEPPGATME